MGSPKVPNVQPHLPMADEKKSIKNIFKRPFQALFQKDKKKEKVKEKDKINAKIEIPKSVDNINVTTPVTDILEKFNKLDLENKDVSDNEDEFDNFSYKIIKDEIREKRNDSHSSEDSGFAEKCINDNANDFEDEKDRDLVDTFKKLSVDQNQVKDSKENGKKTKRLQTVAITRGPMYSSKRGDHAKSVHPYKDTSSNVFSEAHKVVCGLQTMAGGQVIVNSNIRPPENCTDIETALKLVDMSVTNFAQNSQQEQVDRWQIAQEYVKETDQDKLDDMLSEFISNYDRINPQITNFPPNNPPTPNPVEEFSNTNHTFDYDIDLPIIDESFEKPSIFLTPPRSENVPSPMSDSQTSFYPTTDYTLSPDTSSPMHNSDYEKYQDITPIDDYPSCITDNIESDKETDKKKEKSSSMTMKQFKDLQKQIATDFSKKECCQISRKSCKAIFEEHIRKLDIEERKNICYKVANLDFRTAYGVLHHILFNLSNDKDEDINLALFSLICEKVLALRPMLFVDDFGLNILKLAVLRCYTRPLLTRYIVQCIRAVTRSEAYKRTNEHVFSEVDTLGDNLVIACARAGDECADVLSELVRSEDNDIPLFNIHHANTDGHTALHVCCAEHGARAPHAHALHVLLRHAGADLWRGDIKGGDTPLHLAVNSPNCDLTIVMILFQHIDRKEWRRLAHVQNRSSVNPLEYARSAVKSTTRQNYPIEVLDFLKKCR